MRAVYKRQIGEDKVLGYVDRREHERVDTQKERHDLLFPSDCAWRIRIIIRGLPIFGVAASAGPLAR